jgi:hypothetical protein
MFSFREHAEHRSRAIWASYPLESSSKSSLFIQAERISDEALHEVLSRHLA